MYYFTEEEALFFDKYKGHFNKKLADWAISHMMKKSDTASSTSKSDNLEPVKKKTIDEYEEFLKENKINIPEESFYDGYYLWHMVSADYPKSIEDKKHAALYIEETICDPDCEPTAVLACFKAKMDVMRVPIYWELYM